VARKGYWPFLRAAVLRRPPMSRALALKSTAQLLDKSEKGIWL